VLFKVGLFKLQDYMRYMKNRKKCEKEQERDKNDSIKSA